MSIWMDGENGVRVERFQGCVVNTHRTWNNSMYIYHDYATVFDGCGFDSMFIGVDYLDGIPPTSVVDASEPVKALYSEYLNGIAKMHHREDVQKLVAKNIPAEIAESLLEWRRQGIRDRDFYPIERLLSTTCRSEFRKSLQKQVVEYFKIPISRRAYRLPLSDKQYNCLMYRGR